VTEAKRQPFGRVRIDLSAGPKERPWRSPTMPSMAKSTPSIRPAGPDTGHAPPTVPSTNSREPAEDTLAEIDRIPGAHGEAVSRDTQDERPAMADDIASGRVQGMTGTIGIWTTRPVPGPRSRALGTPVADGDKVVGTDHAPPSGRVGRHAGGLRVGSRGNAAIIGGGGGEGPDRHVHVAETPGVDIGIDGQPPRCFRVQGPLAVLPGAARRRRGGVLREDAIFDIPTGISALKASARPARPQA